jgi:hypothetical protein
MRQLELTHFRSPPGRKETLAPPHPAQVLTDEVTREVVRLMAQALLAVLKSDEEASDER